MVAACFYQALLHRSSGFVRERAALPSLSAKCSVLLTFILWEIQLNPLNPKRSFRKRLERTAPIPNLLGSAG